MKNTGQASIEYMVMMAVSLLIFAAILGFSLNMFSGVRSELAVGSSFKAVQEIKEAADFIYVHGHPSKIRRNVQLPSNIENLTIQDKLIKIRIMAGKGMFTDIYDVAKGNITALEALDYMCPTNFGTKTCNEGNFILNMESMEASTGYAVNITAG